MKTITFLRHGESTGNASGVIQGRGSSPLSERGARQAAAVARRLGDHAFDRVVSSDMERAVQTAEVLGRAFATDPVWREMDVGGWDGLTNRDIREQFADELLALSRGEDVRLGGTGETMFELGERVAGGIRVLLEELPDGGSGLVVCHGGVIEATLAIVLGGGEFHRRIARVTNTALTTVVDTGHGLQLSGFNDAAHLDPVPGWAGDRLRDGQIVLGLVRHGRTDANSQGRWQGQTDTGLNDEGRRQARELAAWYRRPDTVYSSPLGRAYQTAEVLANGSQPVMLSGLAELGMGRWEGSTAEEIVSAWPELWHRIYRDGEDLPRGGDGETWAEMQDRVGSAVARAVGGHESGHLGIVSHGAAIRGYVSSILGLDHSIRERLRVPGNTSVSHVVVEDGRVVLADFNVAPHLAERSVQR